MTKEREQRAPSVRVGIEVIPGSSFKRIDFADFAPGLIAIESVGDSVERTSLGPLAWIHDAFYDPGRGIPHHPHDRLEHLMLVIEGATEHDDSRNGVHAVASAGDLIRMTSGTTGVVHSERNHRDDVRSRVLLLVYEPDVQPPIVDPSYAVLKADHAVRLAESEGVETRQLVGGSSPFEIHHSRLVAIADTTMDPAAAFSLELKPASGLLLYPFEGVVRVADDQAEVRLPATTSGREGPGAIAVAWTDDEARRVEVTADGVKSRVVRIEFRR